MSCSCDCPGQPTQKSSISGHGTSRTYSAVNSDPGLRSAALSVLSGRAYERSALCGKPDYVPEECRGRALPSFPRINPGKSREPGKMVATAATDTTASR